MQERRLYGSERDQFPAKSEKSALDVTNAPKFNSERTSESVSYSPKRSIAIELVENGKIL